MRHAEAAALRAALLSALKQRPGATANQLASASISTTTIQQRLSDLKKRGVVGNVVVRLCIKGGATIGFWYVIGEKNARGLAERAAATAQCNARLAKEKALAAKARAEKQAAQAKLAQEIKAARVKAALDEESVTYTASDIKGVGPEDLAWMAHYQQKREQRLARTS